jgi:hypothetical protein
MNYFKVTLLVFILLAASRFIPHPPNFTSLLALSFYIPALLGIRYIPALIVSFIAIDLIIGFHGTTLFTWGSVLLIGLMSKHFTKNITRRLSGSLIGAHIFFILTNFGVWTLGSYGYSIEGFIACYTLAIPFFSYSLISTFIFSGIIETLYKMKVTRNALQIKT